MLGAALAKRAGLMVATTDLSAKKTAETDPDRFDV
jgi:hypothetical protein